VKQNSEQGNSDMERKLSLNDISQHITWHKNKQSSQELLSDLVMYKSAMSGTNGSLDSTKKKSVSEWEHILPSLTIFMDEIGLRRNVPSKN